MSTAEAKLTDRALRSEHRIFDAIRAARPRELFAYLDREGLLVNVGDPAPPSSYRRLAREIGDELFEAAHGPDPTIGARPVRGVMIDDREVFVADVVSRAEQLLFARVVGPHMDAAVPANTYSYAAGRHRFAALQHGRALVRRGHVFARKADVSDFFGSISADMTVAALEARTVLHETLHNVARFFVASEIVRAANHPRVVAGTAPVFELSRHTLLQGSIVAPMLSNVVGAHVLDEPFITMYGSRVVALRFADDVLLLGRERALVDEALASVREFLALSGLALHPRKTSPETLDLRAAPIRFLGKDVGTSVVTPNEWVGEKLFEASSYPRGSDARLALVRAVVMELQLDPVGLVDHADDLARGYGLGDLFANQIDHLAPARKRLLRRYDAALPRHFREALAS